MPQNLFPPENIRQRPVAVAKPLETKDLIDNDYGDEEIENPTKTDRKQEVADEIRKQEVADEINDFFKQQGILK